jgi:hypothetical protein
VAFASPSQYVVISPPPPPPELSSAIDSERRKMKKIEIERMALLHH